MGKQKKERVLVLASPNGTLTATYAGSFRRLPEDHKRRWQVIIRWKAHNAMSYRNSAYRWAVRTYGL